MLMKIVSNILMLSSIISLTLDRVFDLGYQGRGSDYVSINFRFNVLK